MLCETVREQIHTLSDGESLQKPNSRIVVLVHCVHCSQCRAFRHQLKRLRQTALTLPNTLAVPASLRHRIFTALSPENENAMPVYSSSPHSKRTMTREKEMKKRVAFAVAAFVVPVVAGTLFAQNRRTHPLWTPEQLTTKQNLSNPVSQRPDEPDNAAFQQRLQELRLKWKVWATEHQENLAAMLRETGEQRAAFDRVLNAMPSALTNATILTKEDLDAPGFPLNYIPILRHQDGRIRIRPNNTKGYLLRDGDEETFARMRANEELDKKYPKVTHFLAIEEGRRRFRDIEIVTTMKSGNSYTLWISGRITEQVPTPKNVSGHEFYIFENEREIAPPYEELTR